MIDAADFDGTLGDPMERSLRVGVATLLILLALPLTAAGQSRRSAEQDWRDCRARDIATVIRGCTALIERKGTKRASLAEARLLRGKALAKRGRTREAIADFNEVIDDQPRNARAHLERGVAYWIAADTKRARADMDAAIRLKPDAMALATRGWFLKDDDAKAANADFDKAITLANRATNAGGAGLAEAYHARGDALAGKESYDRSISDFDRAIRLQPDYDEAYLNRGIVYSLKGDNARALAGMDEALRVQPDYASAYFQRGFLRLADTPDLALADFDRMIALAPEDARGFYGRGAVYRKKKSSI
jgi:tetratricopeptide (TPR) repeat protein